MKQQLQYMIALCVISAGTLFAASPVLAQSLGTVEERRYESCMQLTRIDPNQAFEEALAWQDANGGVAAAHCEAVALMLLGHYLQAAERFEALARHMPNEASSDIVADILAHAGLAWMEGEELDHAYAAQSAALELNPDRSKILIDRALVLAQLNRFEEAVKDLSRALQADPDNPSALSMRASAYRFLGKNDLALKDAQQAVMLDPDHPEALLERGILYRLGGNSEGARADWLRVIHLHDGRPAAEAAQRNIELLDVGPHSE